MKNLLFLVLLSLPILGLSQDFPERTNRLVNDYTNTLSKQDASRLEQQLLKYEQESSVQIAIVIIRSLGGYEISDYAFELGEKWGIGQQETSNGALVLVSMDDRKMWIATGYGLEATLTDAMCKRIIENEMKPSFRKNDYAGGLAAASQAIIEVTRGEYQGTAAKKKSKGAPIGVFGIFALIFAFVWVMKAVQVRRYARMNHMGFWAAWALLASSSRSHGGSWSGFSGGGGGFGGGGGGFGGFGGGSFGGGGAGGSW